MFNMRTLRLGTRYGGWYVPEDMNLGADSLVISAGVGEDISFDLLLQDKFHCRVILVDPTLRAVTHFEEIRRFYAGKIAGFSGSIQLDYLPVIRELRPDFSRFTYIAQALWDSSGKELRFYKPKSPAHISHTLIPNMYGQETKIVSAVTLKEVVDTYGDGRSVDLLKLDIEGAEIVVLDHMIETRTFPRYLLVEFDLMLRKRDLQNDTERIMKALGVFYDVVKNDNMNVTLVLKKS